jgi:acyl-CoA thioester hydrolase
VAEQAHPLIVSDKPAALAHCPVVIRLPIQWGEQDAFGHVNNVSSIRWFESGRIAYLDAVGLEHLMEAGKLGVILASITCHYRKQLLYPDTICVGTSVTKLGKTSLIMKHWIYSEKLQAIASEGDSVIVMFDYESQRPTRIPEDLRALLARVENSTVEQLQSTQ